MDNATPDSTKLFAVAELDAARFTPAPFDARGAWKEAFEPGRSEQVHVDGDSGEAERSFRREAERYSGMIPNTFGA